MFPRWGVCHKNSARLQGIFRECSTNIKHKLTKESFGVLKLRVKIKMLSSNRGKRFSIKEHSVEEKSRQGYKGVWEALTRISGGNCKDCQRKKPYL